MFRRAFAFGALVALLLQGSSAGHMLLVEHARCAEHGEWTHESGHHVQAPRLQAEGTALEGVPPTPHENEASHEHCTVATERRDGVAGQAFVPVDRSPVETQDPDRIAGALGLFDSTPRLRLAPKSSPPV